MKNKKLLRIYIRLIILIFVVLATVACSSSLPNTPQAVATATEDVPTAKATIQDVPPPTAQSTPTPQVVATMTEDAPTNDDITQDVPLTPEFTPVATRILAPYPYTTPIPPPTPTILDGIYSRAVKFEGTPTPCRRCAPYRAEGGTWTLFLDAGAFRVSHNATDFQGIGSFTVSGDQLALFNDPNCHAYVGYYTWKQEGQSLILDVIEDDCAFGLRARNLAAGTWKISDQGQIDSCQPPSIEAAISGHWPAPSACELPPETR